MRWLTIALLFFQFNAFAEESDSYFYPYPYYEEKILETDSLDVQDIPNIMDELDPADPMIESTLEQFDEDYYNTTGKSPHIESGPYQKGDCYRDGCPAWSYVNLAEQLMYLYVDGAIKYVWAVSTGKRGYSTPNMDENPNGRIYDRYTSTKYPGGDYNGLGNMPYAVFIRGGYAIHGTTRGNWPYLGTRASKGCIRLHPDNGFIFNRLVRALGFGAVWVTVQ